MRVSFQYLEEFYTEDLQGYYNTLIAHPHHNYYFGQNEADIAAWLEYFLRGMDAIFENVTYEVEKRSKKKVVQKFEKLLRPLNHRARRVLSLSKLKVTIQSADVASLLNISQRQSRDLLRSWVEQGWLEIDDPSRKGRKYRLVEKYLNLLDG